MEEFPGVTEEDIQSCIIKGCTTPLDINAEEHANGYR
jgi:hypothetical protein